MTDPKPIVSLSGEPELHARANAYNARLGVLEAAKTDLESVERWNRSYDHGFWGDQAHEPKPTSALIERVVTLKIELSQERLEIVRLANGSVKP